MSAPDIDAGAYEQVRNASLPWGYWLHAELGHHELIDEDGKSWDSVRQCLWQSRLGLPRRHLAFIDAQLEFMLAILAAHDRRTVPLEERVIDLCDGSWTLRDHYDSWLQALGLLRHSEGHSEGQHQGLSAEGRAVLLMLASTRSAEHGGQPVGLAALGLTHGLDRGTTRAERDHALARIEAHTHDLALRFVREVMHGRPVIKLIGREIGSTIPLARTLWLMAFPDAYARDRLFAWIAQRPERWILWGSLARDEGAQALSEHFLQLALADQPTRLSG